MEQTYEKDKVVKIINSVIEKVGLSKDLSKDLIFRELSDLRSIIEEARASIGTVGATDITGKHIPTATDELDAVVLATADATGQIMDACEVIENIAASLADDVSNDITAHVTKIYESCSFQDITGQRIKKVVGALKAIEEKVQALLNVIGDTAKSAGSGSTESDHSKPFDEKALLNGPQLPGGAISQDDIDKLLESFD